MAASNLVLLNWNVRGLNAPVKHSALRDMATSVHATMVCIQETKLCHIDERLVLEMLGPKFHDSFSFLPSIGTSGGILIASSEDHFKLISSQCTKYMLTIRIQMLNDGTEWSFTGVYDPQQEADKLFFLEELKSLK
jgi:exonuclease III